MDIIEELSFENDNNKTQSEKVAYQNLENQAYEQLLRLQNQNQPKSQNYRQLMMKVNQTLLKQQKNDQKYLDKVQNGKMYEKSQDNPKQYYEKNEDFVKQNQNQIELNDQYDQKQAIENYKKQLAEQENYIQNLKTENSQYKIIIQDLDLQLRQNNVQSSNDYNFQKNHKFYTLDQTKDSLKDQQLLEKLVQVMCVKDKSQLLDIASKYEKCIKMIPKLEKFIFKVCDLIVPEKLKFEPINQCMNETLQILAKQKDDSKLKEFYKLNFNLQNENDIIIQLNEMFDICEQSNAFCRAVRKQLKLGPNTPREECYKEVLYQTGLL